MYQCRCRTDYEKSGLRRYQPSAETENIERYTACRYCDNNGLQCAVSVCAMRISGGLGDPTGKGDEAFLQAVREIEAKMKILTERIKNM